MKSVHIRTYSGPYFPAFELNTERHEVSLRIQPEFGKIIDQNNNEYGHILCSANFQHSKNK